MHGGALDVQRRFMPCAHAVSECPIRSVRGAFMNSDERRAARRRRREAERARKREERLKDCTMESVADLDNLYRAAKQAGNGVSWKASVQRYRKDTLRNIVKARRDLLEGNDIRRGFHYFQLFERGKLRDICSVHFSERVPQKSLSQHALVPALTPTFIHILLIDFKSYFANIAHGPLKEIVARSFDDPRIVKLTHDLIDACGEKGLGLGSEPNQILAVAFPSAIDHFVTEMLGVEGYGRYMDDSYCIHTDKAYLEIVAGLIEWKCGQWGIEINRKKTHIVKLSHGFTWLKKKFSYGENGRIVIRPCRDSITRERRKLKKMRRMVDEGRLTVEQVERSYQSWRGSMLKLDAHRTVLNMDALYRSLFGDDLENVRGGG